MLIIFTITKRHCCNKIDTLHHKKVFICLCQWIPICLSVLKCLFKSQMWTLYNSFTGLTQIYEQNKIRTRNKTTGTDCEQINKLEDAGISLKTLNWLKVSRFIQWGTYRYIKDPIVQLSYPYQVFSTRRWSPHQLKMFSFPPPEKTSPNRPPTSHPTKGLTHPSSTHT